MHLTRVSALISACLVVLAAPAAASAFPGFRTPSGRIHCLYDRGNIRCDLTGATNRLLPRPRSCHFDYGSAFGTAGRGRAHRLCVSDSVFDPHHPVLRYGRTWRRGRIRCTSRFTGLTCRNASGHGFFISRQHQRGF